jgi:hypothetical protein|tara:strand:+ start:2789 stop:3205 length:417 start_codon:yes stop_codon:yes gene_type:complete
MEYYYNNQVKSISQLKESFKNVSFPASGPEAQWMTDNDVIEVEGWPTINSDTQKLEKTDGSIVDGKWRNFEVQEKSNDEKWDELRGKRNLLLTNSDFTQLDDSPRDKSKWKSYREALRDLPENYPNPDDIIWPTEPDS